MKTLDLKIVLPTDILVDEPVSKLTAEATFGSFCLLPRHVDYFVMLVPGLLSYVNRDDRERYLAINGGSLVKKGFDVRIVTQQAVKAENLGLLKEKIQGDFREISERERKARTALASLQANFVQKMLNVEKRQ